MGWVGRVVGREGGMSQSKDGGVMGDGEGRREERAGRRRERGEGRREREEKEGS